MRAIAIGVAAGLFVPVIALGAAVGGFGATGAAGVAVPVAVADIPPPYLALYRAAADRFGIPVAVLAAVGEAECDHGRGDCWRPNAAGAMGPMQFMPQSWAAHGRASGRLEPSPYDPRDAIFAAAAKLAADGIDRDPWRALDAYNAADSYVASVVAWAVAYGWRAPEPILARAVLSHPRLGLRPAAVDDVGAGVVDPRPLAVLLVVAPTHRLDAVGPFRAGHAYYVAGTRRPSHHAFGRAVDIGAVDGAPVRATNARARALVAAVLALPPGLGPDEVGSPWADLGDPRAFADAMHRSHVHLGWSDKDRLEPSESRSR